MKINITKDERYPHYSFLPNLDNGFGIDLAGSYGQWVEVSDTEFEHMDCTRREEDHLQDKLENLYKTSKNAPRS